MNVPWTKKDRDIANLYKIIEKYKNKIITLKDEISILQNSGKEVPICYEETLTHFKYCLLLYNNRLDIIIREYDLS